MISSDYSDITMEGLGGDMILNLLYVLYVYMAANSQVSLSIRHMEKNKKEKVFFWGVVDYLWEWECSKSRAGLGIVGVIVQGRIEGDPPAPLERACMISIILRALSARLQVISEHKNIVDLYRAWVKEIS